MYGSNMNINGHIKSDSAKIDVILQDQTQLDIKTAHVLEGMTGQGRTGIIFEMVDQDGKKYFTKITARLIVNGLAAFARGFMQRVGDNPDQA